MAKQLPFDERLQVAAQLLKRARIFYDIWWFYEGVDTRPEIIDTMNEYSEFFRFDSHAHFVALIVHLAGLFEKRSNSLNLPTLVQEAKEAGLVTKQTISQAGTSLAKVHQLSANVAILRSNLFAHRSASISYEEAFRKASTTSFQLRDLMSVGLMVANLFLVARGLQEQYFHDLSRKDAEAMLNALAKAAVNQTHAQPDIRNISASVNLIT